MEDLVTCVLFVVMVVAVACALLALLVEPKGGRNERR